MRFIAVVTVLGLVSLGVGQKAPKLSSAHKLGGGQSYSSGAYSQSPAAYQGGGSYNSLGGKPVHAQVLSDSRDSNGNFQYAADNGLQQGETVDPDGTRRGFYSYPGADGKPITVKYTAGKNGFVAEGDHLPRQPQVAPHSEKDSAAYRGAGGQEYDDGQYRPGTYSSNSARGHAAPAPATYSSGSQGHGGHAQSAHGHRAGPYSGPASQYTQAHQPAYRPEQPQQNPPRGHGFYGGQDFGPVNYGAPSHSNHAAAPQTQYNTHSLPAAAAPQRYSAGGHGSSGGGQVHSANNPYQQSGPAGPYAGNFDLGNGGQFSINFNPGQSQEVPIGGDFGGHQQRY